MPARKASGLPPQPKHHEAADGPAPQNTRRRCRPNSRQVRRGRSQASGQIQIQAEADTRADEPHNPGAGSVSISQRWRGLNKPPTTSKATPQRDGARGTLIANDSDSSYCVKAIIEAKMLPKYLILLRE